MNSVYLTPSLMNSPSPVSSSLWMRFLLLQIQGLLSLTRGIIALQTHLSVIQNHFEVREPESLHSLLPPRVALSYRATT
jgi:hypothetical protein